jgi:quercetin dioxygenase-like cupin family protein
MLNVCSRAGVGAPVPLRTPASAPPRSHTPAPTAAPRRTEAASASERSGGSARTKDRSPARASGASEREPTRAKSAQQSGAPEDEGDGAPARPAARRSAARHATCARDARAGVRAGGGMFCRMETWDIASLDVEPHRPAVLRSDPEARVIAINLPAGEQLQEHQVHERAWLLVADGEVEIEQDASKVSGGPGFVAHFAPQERREVRAASDSRLLLVLAPWPGEGHPSQR